MRHQRQWSANPIVPEQHELEVLRTRAEEAHAVAKPRLVVRKAPDPGKEIVRAAVEGGVDHIEMARWAELLLIAPATANVIAKLAVGIADDALTTYGTPVRFGSRVEMVRGMLRAVAPPGPRKRPSIRMT